MESSIKDKRRHSGILKTQESPKHQHHQHQPNEHVHFDEVVIAEHDQERGTRMKIEEPKTPYHEELEETEQQHMEDVHMQVSDVKEDEEEIKKHLEEAERNKLLNAQLQKEQQNLQDLHAQLANKLDQTQVSQESEEESNVQIYQQSPNIEHKEFLKKRKDHYKGEFNPAVLLKKNVVEEEEEEK